MVANSRKPDKAAALKQLKTHVILFGAWVAVIRVTPYILHYFFMTRETRSRYPLGAHRLKPRSYAIARKPHRRCNILHYFFDKKEEPLLELLVSNRFL